MSLRFCWTTSFLRNLSKKAGHILKSILRLTSPQDGIELFDPPSMGIGELPYKSNWKRVCACRASPLLYENRCIGSIAGSVWKTLAFNS